MFSEKARQEATARFQGVHVVTSHSLARGAGLANAAGCQDLPKEPPEVLGGNLNKIFGQKITETRHAAREARRTLGWTLPDRSFALGRAHVVRVDYGCLHVKLCHVTFGLRKGKQLPARTALVCAHRAFCAHYTPDIFNDMLLWTEDAHYDSTSRGAQQEHHRNTKATP